MPKPTNITNPLNLGSVTIAKFMEINVQLVVRVGSGAGAWGFGIRALNCVLFRVCFVRVDSRPCTHFSGTYLNYFMVLILN